MISQFAKASVLVVGDVMLDQYYHGKALRISPEAPVPVVNVEHSEWRLGGAANVALNAACLDADVNLLTITGADSAALQLKKLLKAAQVRCYLNEKKELKTTTKLRVISQHQQLLRLDFEQDFSNVDCDFDQYERLLGRVSVVVFSDYGKGVLTNITRFIKAANDKNVMTIIDPKGSDFKKYQGATILTPNLNEFEAVVGKCLDTQQLIEKGQKMLADYALKNLLITRSDKGMLLLKDNGDVLNLPAKAKDVFDVTGAGDTVVATLACALGAGLNTTEATKLANVAAGIVVAKVGTASVDAQELALALNPNDKIVTLKTLSKTITRLRKQNARIVFTNGCFDLLHAGHVNYLAKAKALGAILIVAVNADESVTQLKGSKRPINALAERMTVLSALASVDYVIPFDEATPLTLIETIKPDYLVKGGDYKAQDVVGYDSVTASGGKVVIVDYIKGQSSSAMINAMDLQ